MTGPKHRPSWRVLALLGALALAGMWGARAALAAPTPPSALCMIVMLDGTPEGVLLWSPYHDGFSHKVQIDSGPIVTYGPDAQGVRIFDTTYLSGGTHTATVWTTDGTTDSDPAMITYQGAEGRYGACDAMGGGGTTSPDQVVQAIQDGTAQIVQAITVETGAVGEVRDAVQGLNDYLRFPDVGAPGPGSSPSPGTVSYGDSLTDPVSAPLPGPLSDPGETPAPPGPPAIGDWGHGNADYPYDENPPTPDDPATPDPVATPDDPMTPDSPANPDPVATPDDPMTPDAPGTPDPVPTVDPAPGVDPAPTPDAPYTPEAPTEPEPPVMPQ